LADDLDLTVSDLVRRVFVAIDKTDDPKFVADEIINNFAKLNDFSR
jgi:hypothetical protein